MPNDTYVAGQNNTRAVEYRYNSKTGVWEPVSYSGSDNNTSLSTSTQNGGTVTVDTSSKVNSKAEADSEYIEIEFNTLEGELVLIASKKTIALKVGQTIKIEGIGKYLSGLYYISAIKRTIDNSQGYSHTLTVIKTGFGSTLKSVVVNTNTTSSSAAQRPAEVTPSPSTSFKVGDKVMFLTVAAKKYWYSNASEGVWVPEWVTQKVHTVDGVSSDGERVRLKEIWSWTYAKFLKKV